MCRKFIIFNVPAPCAGVLYSIRAPFCVDFAWPHRAVAEGCAVAGLYIDVLAPEALRAMVGVAVSNNMFTAVLAVEVFFVFAKAGASHVE